MALAVSDITICSAALLMLGQRGIQSFNDDVDAARICREVYPLARQDMLRLHPWNCAIKRDVLAPLAAAPVGTFWAYQFNRPADWLRTLSVGYDGYPLEYAMEGGKLLAATNVLPLRYVADVPEGQWDALLVHAMTKRMEYELAYPVTKSTSLRDTLMQEFHRPGLGVLARAKSVDGQENPPEDLDDSPFISVRSGRRFT